MRVHIDPENVGYAGTSINNRHHPNNKLATALHKGEITVKILKRLG